MFSGGIKREMAGATCAYQTPRPVVWLVVACASGWPLAALADGTDRTDRADRADRADSAVTSNAAESGKNFPRPRLEVSVTNSPGASVNAASSSGPWAMSSTSSQRSDNARETGITPLRLEISSWSHPPEQSAMGLALGVDSSSGAWTENRTGSFVDVGVRWRSAPINQRRLDVVAFRRLSQPNQPQDAYTLINSADQPTYSARVEMQFQSAKFGGLAPELGAIGMQLNGGGKVVLRTKRGGPMVYYRAKF